MVSGLIGMSVRLCICLPLSSFLSCVSVFVSLSVSLFQSLSLAVTLSVLYLSVSISVCLSLSFFFFKVNVIYLFLAALGLRCCMRAFSSCCEWGPLFAAVRGLLIAVASLVAEHGL